MCRVERLFECMKAIEVLGDEEGKERVVLTRRASGPLYRSNYPHDLLPCPSPRGMLYPSQRAPQKIEDEDFGTFIRRKPRMPALVLATWLQMYM
jgi:hypothetical protein